MANTIKTVLKIFILFFLFQITCNILVENLPDIMTIDDDNQDFLNFLTGCVNGNINFCMEESFDTQTTGETLLDNLKSKINTPNLFTEGLLSNFFGVLVAITDLIWFIVQLAITLLFTPSVMLQILLYGFPMTTGYILATTLVINIGFYTFLYYIILKRRVSQ